MFKYFIAALLLANACAVHAAAFESYQTSPTAKTYYDEAGKSLDANKWKPALSSLQKAVELEPNNADIHNLLGYSYRKQGNLDKAFEHYGISLRLNPDHIGAHEYIGETYLLAKDLPNAEKHLAVLESLCSKSCEQYRDLSKAIGEYKSKQ